MRKNGVVVERVCMRSGKMGGIYRYGHGCIHAWKWKGDEMGEYEG